MKQGVLPFQDEEEKSTTGTTALAGLACYLDPGYGAGLCRGIERQVRLREGRQGWSDSAVGAGGGMGDQAAQGGPLCLHFPSRSSSAAGQGIEHPPEQGSSLLRPVSGGTPEDHGTG